MLRLGPRLGVSSGQGGAPTCALVEANEDARRPGHRRCANRRTNSDRRGQTGNTSTGTPGLAGRTPDWAAGLLDAILGEARRINDPYLRATVLASLAPSLPHGYQRVALAEAFACARVVSDEPRLAELLVTVAAGVGEVVAGEPTVG